MPRARNCACSRDDVLFNWWHGGDEGRATCGVRLASPLPSPGVREGAATVRARVVRVGRRAGGRVACWPLVKNAWDALGAVPGVASDHFRAAFRQTRRPRRA